MGAVHLDHAKKETFPGEGSETDLVDYRVAVDRTQRRISHNVIGIERYIAEGNKPVERCKADVRTADIYVIILARRFGYVPLLKRRGSSRFATIPTKVLPFPVRNSSSTYYTEAEIEIMLAISV